MVDFDKELKKLKKKMLLMGKELDGILTKGFESGRKYHKKAKIKIKKFKGDVDEHIGKTMKEKDIGGKFRHVFSHLKFTNDVTDKGKFVVVKTPLPGVEKKDVILKITNDHIEIKAIRKEQVEISKKGMHKKAVSEKMFQRLLPLPKHVDHEKAKAEINHGLLTIVIPKKKIARKLKPS